MTAPTLPDVAKAELAILEMTNDFRKKYGLGVVKPDNKLANAARAYAEYLARSGKFAHDGDGRQPAERVTAAGYQYCFVAENLALNQSSAGFQTRDLAKQMVEGWVNSPGHRKNLLAEHATETAVAVAKGPDRDPKYVAVQLFARPKSLAYQFQISNSTGGPVRYSFGGKTHDLKPDMGVTHTACTPDEVTFEGATPPSSGKASLTRHKPADGEIINLQKTGGGYRVDVRQKERIP